MKIPACVLGLLCVASIGLSQTANPVKAKMMESTVFDWKDLKSETRPNGERRAVFDNPTASLANLECHVTTLKVGETSGAAHPHNTGGLVEELTVVKEGTVEVWMNDRHQTIGPGSVFYFAPKDSVAIKNVGATPATYVVISIRAQPAPTKN
jgi:mannose-6-phosphate isomerase-like protein (cupin superfamily)